MPTTPHKWLGETPVQWRLGCYGGVFITESKDGQYPGNLGSCFYILRFLPSIWELH